MTEGDRRRRAGEAIPELGRMGLERDASSPRGVRFILNSDFRFREAFQNVNWEMCRIVHAARGSTLFARRTLRIPECSFRMFGHLLLDGSETANAIGARHD